MNPRQVALRAYSSGRYELVMEPPEGPADIVALVEQYRDRLGNEAKLPVVQDLVLCVLYWPHPEVIEEGIECPVEYGLLARLVYDQELGERYAEVPTTPSLIDIAQFEQPLRRSTARAARQLLERRGIDFRKDGTPRAKRGNGVKRTLAYEVAWDIFRYLRDAYRPAWKDGTEVPAPLVKHVQFLVAPFYGGRFNYRTALNNRLQKDRGASTKGE
jgi:hypothetical protein